ncbi:sag-related sequence srs53f [Cystoisospora suis]|uniref:Sag-related sequence srs53f n=1 Tax=Cystoisospora suis TaxID=483139 RepID=A0A2C6KQ55_9APIC|nr:sag-related sequence srs53f [Cystoisospora suis]
MDRSLLLSCAVVALVLSTSSFTSVSLVRGEALTGATEPRQLNETSTAQKCLPAPQLQNITVKLSPYTLEAKFDCGIKEPSSTNQVAPSVPADPGKCCNADATDCEKTILSVVGVNGSTSMEDTTKVITVKLDDTPKKTDQNLFFKCSKTGADDKCIVSVEIPKTFSGSQCNFDRNVQLPPIAQPNTEATFECGGTVAPEPNDTQVFKGPECTGTASKLSDLVPGATLVGDGSGNYTLKVATLPKETQDLCFKCDYPDPRKNKTQETATCKVTVAVSGISKTTTASTTTSDAEGIVVTSYAALAFAFFSAAAGVYY